MPINLFITELTDAAAQYGCPLDHEARAMLLRLLERAKVEWASSEVQRSLVKARVRVVVLRAVLQARNERLNAIDGRLMRLAMADAERSRA